VAFRPETWAAFGSVLHPGAHLLAFGGTRTWHRLAVAIEDAGFEIRDTLMWLYGQGFPKSHDVSKGIDKSAGDVEFGADRMALSRHIRECREARGVSKSQLAEWFPQYSAVTRNWERADAGRRTPSLSDYDILVERLGCDVAFRDLVRVQAEREVVGVSDDGLAQGWSSQGLAGYRKRYNITAPATDAAKQWDGWGTALKPAWEPVILARWPLDGTVAETCLRHGCGALNIDGCRIPTREDTGRPQGSDIRGGAWVGSTKRSSVVTESNPLGRWPANLIHDGSDEVVELMPQTKSGKAVVGTGGNGKSLFMDGSQVASCYADEGSAARFFYCAKASKAERGSGNDHPTVKPLDLCRYLALLLLPPEACAPRRLFVPFAGSGSEMIGARQAGWDEVVGVEISNHYADIARERLAERIGML
jgi:hypothetical protein